MPEKKNVKKTKPTNSREIVKIQTKVESIIKTPADITVMAKFFADSKMFPELETIAQNFVVIEAGRELGIQAVMAGQTIHFINNRDLAIESKVLAAIALDNGIRWKIHKKDPEGCKLEFYKPGSNIPHHTETFTIKDAERAHLSKKNNWIWYPEEMCWNRCFAKGIKVFDPRIGLGFYTKEEAEDFVTKEEMGEDVQDAEIVDDGKTREDMEEDQDQTEEPEEVEEEPEEEEEEEPPVPDPELDPGDKPTAAEDKKRDDLSADVAQKLEQNIETVKNYLKIQDLFDDKKTPGTYPEFKEFLGSFQASRDPVRKIVGRNVHGHWSLHCGAPDDVQIMTDHLSWSVTEFVKWCYSFKGYTKVGPFENMDLKEKTDA